MVIASCGQTFSHLPQPAKKAASRINKPGMCFNFISLVLFVEGKFKDLMPVEQLAERLALSAVEMSRSQSKPELKKEQNLIF